MRKSKSAQLAIFSCGAGKNGESRKRRNSMKGVFQNKKTGNWYIDYRLPNGRRRRETVGTSKKLAENVLSKRRVGIAEGRFLDVVKKERIKFEDFAQEYFTIHSKQHKKGWQTDSFNIKIF